MGQFYQAGAPYHAQEKPDYCAPAVAFSILSDTDVKLDLQGKKELELFRVGDGGTVSGWSVTPAGIVKILQDQKPRGSGGFKRDFVPNLAHGELDGTAQIVGQLAGASGVAPAALIWGKIHWVGVNAVELVVTGSSYKLLKLWLLDPFSLGAPNSDHATHEDCWKFGVPDYFVFYPFGWRQMFTGYSEQGVQVFVTIGLSGEGTATAPGVISGSGVTIIRDAVTGKVVQDSIPDLWDAWMKIYGDWPQNSIASSYMPGSRALASVTVKGIGIDGEWYLFPIEKDGALVGTGAIDALSGWPTSLALYGPGSEWRRHVERLVGDLAGEVLKWRPCAESSTPHLPFRVVTVEGSFKGAVVSRYERLDGPVFRELSIDNAGR
jgi:hypothetical protein